MQVKGAEEADRVGPQLMIHGGFGGSEPLCPTPEIVVSQQVVAPLLGVAQESEGAAWAVIGARTSGRKRRAWR
jgi:hypothetical protein